MSFPEARAKFASTSETSDSDDPVWEEPQPEKSLLLKPQVTIDQGKSTSDLDQGLSKLVDLKLKFKKAKRDFRNQHGLAVQMGHLCLNGLQLCNDPQRSKYLKKVKMAYNFYKACKDMLEDSEEDLERYHQESLKAAIACLDANLNAYFQGCRKDEARKLLDDIEILPSLESSSQIEDGYDGLDHIVDGLYASTSEMKQAEDEVEDSFQELSVCFEAFRQVFSSAVDVAFVPMLQPVVEKAKMKVGLYEDKLKSCSSFMTQIDVDQIAALLGKVQKELNEDLAIYEINCELAAQLRRNGEENPSILEQDEVENDDGISDVQSDDS